MNILIAAATSFEIGPFMELYRAANSKVDNQHSIDVLLTGIGLTAATYHLQRQLMLKPPDLVIQVGIAGCFQKAIPLGTVVVVKKDTIADEGVVEGGQFRSLFDLGFLKPNQFPFSKKWLINPDTDLVKATGLKAVTGISVNQITTSRILIDSFKETLKPSTESMEGAALHFTCLQVKCRFLQLRGISNYIGERNKKKWNLKDSIFNVNNELVRVLKSL